MPDKTPPLFRGGLFPSVRRSGKERKSLFAKAESFKRENCKAANFILTAPERFGGESAGLVQWARLALQGERQRVPDVREVVEN